VTYYAVQEQKSITIGIRETMEDKIIINPGYAHACISSLALKSVSCLAILSQAHLQCRPPKHAMLTALCHFSLKVGFHYPSSRPEFTGLPELTARVDGCQKMHPSSRAVNSARDLGPSTRVVETDLYTFLQETILIVYMYL